MLGRLPLPLEEGVDADGDDELLEAEGPESAAEEDCVPTLPQVSGGD